MALDYSYFKKKFMELTGMDLNSYKDQQMERRVRQFMSRVNVSDFHSYCKLLETNEKEKKRFLNYLTINTTSFFRDASVYNNLRDKVIPEMIERKRGAIKIWSAGCSIGAEPYSLAILMAELAGSVRYTINATDLDVQALQKAREGRYNYSQLESISKNLLSKYFNVIEDDLYEVKPEVKKVVTFKKQNLLEDSFEKGFDMILCRNVFIYFKQETQNKLMEKFIASLNPRGYFIIGSSENIGDAKSWDLRRAAISIFQKEN